MASSREFAQFVCEQLSDAGEITCKRMFGEYGLYCCGKFFATVEDDRMCVKITDAGRAFWPEAEVIEPHPGSHMLYIEELDDRVRLAELVRRTCAALPAPRQKRRKKGD